MNKAFTLLLFACLCSLIKTSAQDLLYLDGSGANPNLTIQSGANVYVQGGYVANATAQGMDLDGEGSGARLTVRLITGRNQSCGTFITPFIPGKFRPTPIRNDGTRYAWNLDYDGDRFHSGRVGDSSHEIKTSARTAPSRTRSARYAADPGFRRQ